MMEKEIKLIEKEMQEINKFEELVEYEDILTFSESCGGTLTLICC